MTLLDTLLDDAPGACPIHLVRPAGFAAWRDAPPEGSGRAAAWLTASGFEGKAGRHALIPGPDGGLAAVVLVAEADEPGLVWDLAALRAALPAGDYALNVDAAAPADAAATAQAAALGWVLGGWRFDRYRRQPAQGRDAQAVRLAWPAAADRSSVRRMAEAILLVRSLVTTPAEDMGPDQIADAARGMAARHGARFRLVRGDALLAENYPMIHAVGRASARPPLLVDLRWGPEDAPRLGIVGKGVVFDTGGLDLKPAAGMALMKKDMGGAAHALALAGLVMDAGLNVRLRLLLPCVENAVSGNAFRPGDVLASRRGLSVEIGNTDAEGRLILADALADAGDEAPDLLLDFATLTGAARVALGPEVPPFFTDDDELAAALAAASQACGDPLWRLPLHAPYRSMIDSTIADINNAGEGGFAGAVTAALFLKEFVGAAKSWAHFDIYAWNAKARPGRPVGGEAMALRAVFRVLEERYGAR
ncbi:leucyl aminopeptidase family protein [Marinibaculum pumilum]|uniref:Leucyl aminopeptidase family protein n=1 Tax=Marinibaculum pumilum TaxID=1766165 RepID=A0ABV7L6B3_9PROT